MSDEPIESTESTERSLLLIAGLSESPLTTLLQQLNTLSDEALGKLETISISGWQDITRADINLLGAILKKRIDKGYLPLKSLTITDNKQKNTEKCFLFSWDFLLTLERYATNCTVENNEGHTVEYLRMTDYTTRRYETVLRPFEMHGKLNLKIPQIKQIYETLKSCVTECVARLPFPDGSSSVEAILASWEQQKEASKSAYAKITPLLSVISGNRLRYSSVVPYTTNIEWPSNEKSHFQLLFMQDSAFSAINEYRNIYEGLQGEPKTTLTIDDFDEHNLMAAVRRKAAQDLVDKSHSSELLGNRVDCIFPETFQVEKRNQYQALFDFFIQCSEKRNNLWKIFPKLTQSLRTDESSLGKEELEKKLIDALKGEIEKNFTHALPQPSYPQHENEISNLVQTKNMSENLYPAYREAINNAHLPDEKKAALQAHLQDRFIVALTNSFLLLRHGDGRVYSNKNEWRTSLHHHFAHIVESYTKGMAQLQALLPTDRELKLTNPNFWAACELKKKLLASQQTFNAGLLQIFGKTAPDLMWHLIEAPRQVDLRLLCMISENFLDCFFKIGPTALSGEQEKARVNLMTTCMQIYILCVVGQCKNKDLLVDIKNAQTLPEVKQAFDVLVNAADKTSIFGKKNSALYEALIKSGERDNINTLFTRLGLTGEVAPEPVPAPVTAPPDAPTSPTRTATAAFAYGRGEFSGPGVNPNLATGINSDPKK